MKLAEILLTTKITLLWLQVLRRRAALHGAKQLINCST